MVKEYIVKGHYFENKIEDKSGNLRNLKKGLQEGKIILLKDNKIFGELRDLDYIHQGDRVVLGIYDETFPNSIHFIKIPPSIIQKPKDDSTKCCFIYSLTSEAFRQNFGGIYKGYWVPVESNFEGFFANLLKINQNKKLVDLLNILAEQPNSKNLKRLNEISADFLKEDFFNDAILERLEYFAGITGKRALLEFAQA